MAKQTYLGIVNQVLKRLRQATVATVTENSYSTLISVLVNDAKREIEDAWDWSRLQTTITIPTVAGTTQYSLTGAGERFRMMDDLIWNDTEEMYLRPRPIRWIRALNRDDDVTNEIPHFYAFDGVDASGDPTISIYPPPDGVYSFNVDVIVPQADLSADGDEIDINWRPIYLRALALAISERGEDGGATYNEIDAEARNALADATAQDVALQRDKLILRVE